MRNVKCLRVKERPESSDQVQQDADVRHRRRRTQRADDNIWLSARTGMNWPWAGAWDLVILHFQRLQNYASGDVEGKLGSKNFPFKYEPSCKMF